MNESKLETLGEVDVLIQGAGIGGLSLALGLIKRGYSVRLIERAQNLSEVGAGIWMAPNALQVFEDFGIGKTIQKTGWPIHQVELMDHTGKVLSSLNMEPLKNEFGFYTLAFHRADLQFLLSASVGEDKITFASEVISWDEHENHIDVLLSKGEKIRTKLLIGADGLNSKIRGKLFPASAKRYSGSSSFRAIVPTPAKMKSRLHVSREIWAPGCRLGFSPLSEEKMYWYLTFDSLPGEEKTPAENKALALHLASQFFPEHLDLIELAQGNAIIRTDIYDLKLLTQWSVKRVGLMGDAAHAMTPNLGQGGAQAVEDAHALVSEIEKQGLNPKALSSFFSRRKKKVSKIVNDSWTYGLLCHKKNPLSRYFRNEIFRLTPPSVVLKQFKKIYRLE